MPSSPTLRLLLQERLKQEFTKEQRQEVADFYFNHYRTHISSKRSLADALASIPQVPAVLCVPGDAALLAGPVRKICAIVLPQHAERVGMQSLLLEGYLCMQVNMYDDHDIFDGWGSYPPRLQLCPVFKGAVCHGPSKSVPWFETACDPAASAPALSQLACMARPWPTQEPLHGLCGGCATEAAPAVQASGSARSASTSCSSSTPRLRAPIRTTTCSGPGRCARGTVLGLARLYPAHMLALQAGRSV